MAGVGKQRARVFDEIRAHVIMQGLIRNPLGLSEEVFPISLIHLLWDTRIVRRDDSSSWVYSTDARTASPFLPKWMAFLVRGQGT